MDVGCGEGALLEYLLLDKARTRTYPPPPRNATRNPHPFRDTQQNGSLAHASSHSLCHTRGEVHMVVRIVTTCE